jgi:hypothetical protein
MSSIPSWDILYLPSSLCSHSQILTREYFSLNERKYTDDDNQHRRLERNNNTADGIEILLGNHVFRTKPIAFQCERLPTCTVSAYHAVLLKLGCMVSPDMNRLHVPVPIRQFSPPWGKIVRVWGNGMALDISYNYPWR